jgi:hypothetical protein
MFAAIATWDELIISSLAAMSQSSPLAGPIVLSDPPRCVATGLPVLIRL